MMQNMSELAQITAQIVAEYEAGKRGLEGLAQGTTQHQFITQKTENMSRYHTRLVTLVGETRAGEILAEVGL